MSEELFHDPHQLGVAALLMMDLDNLKHINDTYGHDWGDQYIHRTGRCLAENTPNGTVVSRLSGDEFVLLFYGYSSQDQIREKIRTLSSAMQKSVAILPSGNELRIRISGGVAWYPANGTDMDTLKKYADFDLYMQIIAEGVETAAELRKVIELGADALQGYFLAKPAAVPAKMAPAARRVIAEYSSASDSG